MDSLLGVDDLSRLYTEYFTYRTQWRAIGCALGVSAADLEAIEINQRGKCEDCFRRVLIRWLRKGGRKTESQLRQAIDLCNPVVSPDASLLTSWLCLAILVLLSIVSALPAVHAYRWLAANPLTAAAHTLKGMYKHHPVVEFELLDFTANMPYLNVTMESAGMTVEFWELLNSLDSKHAQLQATGQRGKLERVLITGRPGAGKTTLMRYLAKEWANGARLRSCKVLFLIHLGCLAKDKKPQSLSDLLQLSPYNDLDLKALSKEIDRRQGAGVCFLLDSYDEWMWDKDFVHRLFFEFHLQSSLCIQTSRPYSKYNTKQPNIEYINMTGFPITDLEKCLEILSTNSNVTSSIKTLWYTNHHIRELCTLPLNMAMLLSIVKNGEGSDFNTITAMYSAFMNATVMHFSSRLQDWNTVSLWECILNVSDSHSTNLCIALKELHHAAFEMFFNGIDTFPDRGEITRDISKLGFVKITKMVSNGNRVRYSFFHPTFQEFFAAIHLLNLNQEEMTFLYFEHRRGMMRERSNPWLFYFGLMGSRYREFEDDVLAILRCISVCERMSYPYRRGTVKLLYEYVREIGWTGRMLNGLLDSAGIVVNSTFYIRDIDTEFNVFQYITAHANIHELRFEAYDCKGYVYFNEEMLLYAQIDWNWCLLPLSAFHSSAWRLREPPFVSCLYTLQCLHNASTNLRSSVHLTLDLANSYYVFNEAVLFSTEKFQNLESVNLTLKFFVCENLTVDSNAISILKHAPRRLEGLEIQHRHRHLHHIAVIENMCIASIFSEIRNFHMLRKLIFTGPMKVVEGSSLTKSDVLQDAICELKELQMLRLHSVGPYKVQRLLPCLPRSLHELNLCENNITDQNVITIAQELKHLHELESLSLCDNSIKGDNLKSLVETLALHRNFSSLDLSNNHLSNSDGITALGNLHNLRELKIKSSRVDVKELVKVLVSNEIRLDTLHISVDSSIGFRSLLPIAQLENLRHLDISIRFSVILYYRIEEIRNLLESDLLVEVLKNLTQLETFKLCDYPSRISSFNGTLDRRSLMSWSKESVRDLVRLISRHLPHLRLFHAPCLYDYDQE